MNEVDFGKKMIAAASADRRALREQEDLPTKAHLEAIVEKTTKCGECKGKVRAVIEDAEPSGPSGIDFKVAIYCPSTKCDWKVTQWRPWSKNRPEEL